MSTSTFWSRADRMTDVTTDRGTERGKKRRREGNAGGKEKDRSKTAEREKETEPESHLCCHGHEQRCVSVWLSRQRAATHLEVSVHNIMLVDMIDTLQDLANAVTTERKRKEDKRGDVSAAGLHYKNMTNLAQNLSVLHFTEAWGGFWCDYENSSTATLLRNQVEGKP